MQTQKKARISRKVRTRKNLAVDGMDPAQGVGVEVVTKKIIHAKLRGTSVCDREIDAKVLACFSLDYKCLWKFLFDLFCDQITGMLCHQITKFVFFEFDHC